MKTFFRFLLLPVLAMTAATACGDKTKDIENPDDSNAPFLKVSPKITSFTFLADQSNEETRSFSVETNQGEWTVEGEKGGWCTITKTSMGFYVRTSTNTSISPMPAETITVSAGDKVTPITIVANQLGNSPTLSIAPDGGEELLFSSAATEKFVFTVTTNALSWDAKADDASWCVVTKSETGFTITANVNTTTKNNKTIVRVTAPDVTEIAIDVAQLGEGVVAFTGAETAAGSYNSGSGSSDDPFVIATATQLARLVSDTETDGKAYKLATNFRVTAPSWKPIGGTDGFKGKFDGDEHIISGRLASTAANLGFFGKVVGGDITKLTISADVISSYNGSETATTGAIAGIITGGSTITNCAASGYVKGGQMNFSTSAVDSYYATGGIVGSIDVACEVRSVNNHGEVKGSSTASLIAYSTVYVGGIAGECKGSIVKSGNSGPVSGDSSGSMVSSLYFTGGVVGIGTTVNECTNNGAVTGASVGGMSAAENCTGGIGGSLGNSSDCTNTGAVKGGSSVSSIRTGGIAGKATGPMHQQNNSGTVTSGVSSKSVAVTGGIAGFANGNSIFSCCSNTGEVDGKAAASGNQIGTGNVTECTAGH